MPGVSKAVIHRHEDAAAGVLALALSTTGLFVGQIRHPEIRAGAPGPQAAAVEGRAASRRDDD